MLLILSFMQQQKVNMLLLSMIKQPLQWETTCCNTLMEHLR